MQRASLRPRLVLAWLAGVLAGTLGSYVAAAAASPGQSDPPESTTASTTAGTAPDGSESPEPPDGSEGSEGSGAPEASEGPRHLALNTSPEDHERLVELGYDVFDVGPEASQIEALPEGGQAMLWVGDFSCDEGFGIPFDEFTGLVDELGDHPGVYGWYLVDEPDPEACPEVVEGIRQRADHIHEHAPGQLAFVAITDYEMGPLAPESSHVDLLGLDPYPCTLDDEESCDLSVMDRYMDQALDAGIPREDIAPVIQVFGQSCATELTTWRLPTEAELQEVLARWDTLVPAPRLEISYSWGRQEAWACPALVDADGTDGMPDLQSVMQQRNTRTPPAGGGEGSGTGDGSRCPVPPTGDPATDDPTTDDTSTSDTETDDTGTDDPATGDAGTDDPGTTGDPALAMEDSGSGDADPGGEPAEDDAAA